MTSDRVTYLACFLVVLAATVATVAAAGPVPGRQTERGTVTKIDTAELDRGLFVDEGGERVDVPREVVDRTYGFGAAIQSTRRPDAALVGVSANKLVVYDSRNRSFTVVDRPSKANLQNVPRTQKKFVDPDRAQVSSEVIRGRIVVGTGFGPLVYDLSNGTWAGDDPFAISLRTPWLFDTDPRPPIRTESYVVQPNANGGVFVTVPGWPNNLDERYPDHAITRTGQRMALSRGAQSRPGFPVIFSEGMGNATAEQYASANVVAQPGTDTVFAMWRPPGEGARLIAYNLSTASQEWSLDRTDLARHADYPYLQQISDVRYHDGSLYVLARFTSTRDGSKGIIDNVFFELAPENGSVETAYGDARGDDSIAAVDDDTIVSANYPGAGGVGVTYLTVWNRTSGEQQRQLTYHQPVEDVVLVEDTLFMRFEETDEVEVVHLPTGENATASVMPDTSTEYGAGGRLYDTPEGITVAGFQRGYLRKTDLTRSVTVQTTVEPSSVVFDVTYVTGTPAENATVTVDGVSKAVADDGTARFSLDELGLANASPGRVERPVSVRVAGTEHTSNLTVDVSREPAESDATSTPTSADATEVGSDGFGPVAAFVAALVAVAMRRNRRE